MIERPLCCIPAVMSSASCGSWAVKPWATNVAPWVRASKSGLTGRSIMPLGVDLDFLPLLAVGETWPVVRP